MWTLEAKPLWYWELRSEEVAAGPRLHSLANAEHVWWLARDG